MTDPELVEAVRCQIAETLGVRRLTVRALLVMTPEKLDAIAEAATDAALGNDHHDRQDTPCGSP